MFSKILAGTLVVLGLLGMGSACDDPGDPNGGGKAKPVIVWIYNGTTLSKKTYGLWEVAPGGPKHCRWNVTIKGKNVASGSEKDKVIVGSGLRGGVLHTTCGKFQKVFN